MKKEKISSAFRISMTYALIGGLWILLSDQAVALLFPKPEQLLVVQTYKGWFFIVSTAFILFFLIRNQKSTLKRAEQGLSDLFESTVEGIFRSSPDGRFLSINAAMAQIFGYNSPEEMVEQVADISTQIHLSAESRRRFTEILERDDIVKGFEARNKKKDGSVIWTSTSARIVRDENGNVLYYEGFVTDITKQKNAEEALTEAEKRYRMLVENLPAVVFLDKFREPETTQYMSPRLVDLLGYTPEEWETGDNLWENSIHPDDKERVMAEDKRTDETGEPFRIEYRLRHHDGHYVWIKEDASIVSGKDGTPLFWQGILLDISSQKQAEENLRRRDAILKAVGFSAEQFLKSSNWKKCIDLVLKELGEATQVSRAYVFMKYLSPENIVMVTQIAEWSDAEVKPQIDNPELQDKDFAADGFPRWIKYFDQGLPVYGSIRDFPKEEQDFLTMQNILSLACIPLQVGKDWWGFIGFDECIHEHEWSEAEIGALKAAANTLSKAIEKKLADEALLGSETSYRGLFNSIHDAIYIQNADGVFLDVNDGATGMYGYSREEIIGQMPTLLSAPGRNNLEEISHCVKRAFQGEVQRFEFWGMRKNGEVFPKDVHLFKGTYFGQDVVIAVAQDITERRRSEDETQRQLKELTVMHAVALAESTAQNVDELLQQVTDIIGDMLYPDTCGILLVDESGTSLKPHPSYRGTTPEDLSLSMPLTVGVTGKVASTGQPICVGDVSLIPEYHETINGIRSELCVPISIGSKIAGVLNVESKIPNAFTTSDERLLNTIANGLAKTTERIRLFELEQNRRKQAETLREATGELNSLVKEEKLFENIFDSLAKLIDYDSASIEVLKNGSFEIVAGKNIPEELIGKRYESNLEKWDDLYRLRLPVIIPDVRQDERFTIFEETNYIRSWMGIPLFVTDKIIGFLNLDSRTPGFFTKEHASIAQTFANQAAIAMENARLFQEERRRAKIIETMANIASEITVTRDMLPALDKIARHALSLLNALRVAVYLLEDDKQTIRIVAAQGAYRKELLTHTIQRGVGITGSIIAAGKPEIVDNIATDPRAVTVPGTPQEDAKFETMMSAPLILHGETIGAINVWRTKSNGLFDKSELDFLVSITHQVSISIESMRLFEETKHRAQEAAAIAEVGRDISATLDLNNVLERIAMYARILLHTETSAVYLLEPHNGLLRAIAAIGLEAEEIKNDPVQTGRGILGNIALYGQGEIVNNAINDPRTIAIKGTQISDYEHIMGAPILSKENLTGLLVVWRSGTGREFKEAELIFLRSLAQQAAIAIENARLFELEQRRRKEAETLSQATSALANTLDIKSLYENILDWLQKIAPYDSASIMQHSGNTEKFVATRNLPETFKIGQAFPITKKWKQVAESRRPYIVEDAQQNEYFEKWEDTSYIRGWMCIAMYIQDNLIGFVNLDSKTPGAFTEEHGILAQTFVNQAATAIENARLFDLEQKRRKNAEVIRQAATILTSLLDLPSLHEAILEWLYKITPYESSSIFELEGDRVHLTAARGLPNLKNTLEKDFPADNSLCQIMNQTYEPLIIEDCELDPRFEHWGDIENVRGWMGVPMISRGQVIGYITLDSHIPGAFTQNDAIAAQTFAHQAATSLENSRLFTETRQRLEELEVVSRISFALRAAHDTQEMLPILLEEIKTSLETESAAIWLYDFERNELTAKAVSGQFNRLPRLNFKHGEGIIGTVYSSGITYTNDASSDMGEKLLDKDWSIIAVPIRTANETIGVLAVALNAPRKVKSHQTRLVTTLAEIAGNAIYRSNLYERSEEQIQRLTTLRELDTAIASSLDLRITISILTKHLTTKMGVDATAILVFNPESQTLDHLAAAGFKDKKNLRKTMNLGDSLAGQILLSRRALYIKDLNAENNPASFAHLNPEGFKSYYAIPLFSKGATRGILETYFRQPFYPSTDWIEFIHTLAEQAVIAVDNAQLFENLQRTNQELSLAYDTTLEGWGKALELRDKETQGHTQRVTSLTLELARQMDIPEAELLQVRRGCLLHDIGKMGVPDHILRKNGGLTEEEQVEMRKHPQYAYDMIYPIEYLRPALDIAYCHHEWWDGSGYPRGLKGEEIPLPARIFAITDVWDALSSDRPYRKAWEREKIVEYIRDLSGRQFDPRVVEAFLRMVENDARRLD